MAESDAPLDLASLGQALAEHAPLPMAAVGGYGHITRYANSAFCRLTGRRREEVVGRPFCALMPDPDECAALIERVHRTREPATRAESRTSSGHAAFWTYTLWPVAAGERVLGIMVHVLEHSALQAMNEALLLGSVRQHELTEAAEAASTELREVDRHRSEFLVLLGHELRNPLAPIRYTVEVIKRAGGDEGLVQNALEVMDRQVRHMTRLIDDLLDSGRISHGKLRLRLKEVDLAEVVRDAVEITRPAREAARHELVVTLPDEPVYLHADADRLTQLFGNLLGNAYKFTKPGGHISLTATREVTGAVIVVKDSGIGIQPEMLPKVFEMFSQADQTLERTKEGLGVGLALVRELAALHGGSVEAFSEGENCGSTFVVRLPMVPYIPQRAAPASTADFMPVSGRRILVVDDNRDSAHMLSVVLQMAGNETWAAFDGNEAVEAAERHRPDVILMDIGMPHLNGYEAARRIRKQPWAKGIVLVALTGWGQKEDRKKSADAGFDGHLVKPVERGALGKLLAAFPVTAR